MKPYRPLTRNLANDVLHATVRAGVNFRQLRITGRIPSIFRSCQAAVPESCNTTDNVDKLAGDRRRRSSEMDGTGRNLSWHPALRYAAEKMVAMSGRCLLVSAWALFLAAEAHATPDPIPMPLAGTWRFRLDPGDVGRKEAWHNSVLPDAIRLPGTTDEAGVGERTIGSAQGMLTRVTRYVGPAWYQRYIDVPAVWKDSEIELFLERVLWESRVWIDGRDAGVEDSLGTPHVHALGRLTPGRHSLTIRIDNAMIHPIGDRGHLYTEHTQTIWNGIVGRIEARPRAAVRLGLVRIFPDAQAPSVAVEAGIVETSKPTGGHLQIVIREQASGRAVARASRELRSQRANEPLRVVATLESEPKRWDEFAPQLYVAELILSAGGQRDRRQITFGFRTLKRDARKIELNGRKLFLRGNLDCVHFPLTGYPPADLESWRRILRIYKEHGLNHVRFHSWCPPEAAFQAADELGVYIQAEVLWIDGWMAGLHRFLGATAGSPLGVGKQDRSIDQFVRAEMRRILDVYGNHPSFVLFCIGNELGGSDFDVMGRWIQEEKTRDPRRLYAASTARTITTSDDYTATHQIPGIGQSRGRIEAGTDWDYEANYGKAPVPVIAHEIGQWPVYPEWSEIGKYKRILRARNLEELRAVADRNGIGDMDRELSAASGATSRLMYKYEVESFLRTPSCSGLQLLSMQDYAGQGEALIGWLDSFYESKGTVTPAHFRRWLGPTVPLLRIQKFVWRNDETLSAGVEVAHYGPNRLDGVKAVWHLAARGGAVLAQGSFPPASIQTGGVTPLGRIETALGKIQTAQQLNLRVRLENTEFANDWTVTVFPANIPSPGSPDVLVTRDLTAALSALERGGKVVLLADRLGDEGATKLAAWLPLYWSSSFFPEQNRDTLGAIVRRDHLALAQFPTEGFLDWQWYSLAHGARGFVLDKLPKSFRPIVQPVSDFHFNHKLGSIFEVRTREGGRLLVCGYNVGDGPERIPEARQLLKSLIDYAGGTMFNPSQEVSRNFLIEIFAAAPAAGL